MEMEISIPDVNQDQHPDCLTMSTKLMEYPSYRRLCNIVTSHKENQESIFRNNLIKELYFMLKLTPIIEGKLLEHFLAEVEQWYNLNDHKKIQLGSKRLKAMM